MGAKVKGYIFALIVVFLVSLAGGLVWSANHYSELYEAEKDRADKAESIANQRQDIINDMQVRQHDVAALDAKYTGELADAKAKLDDLRQCVRSGKCGLRVNAICSKGSATAAGSVGDAATARLTESAERDYFTLRERISTITGQVNYLQQYIKSQCLNL